MAAAGATVEVVGRWQRRFTVRRWFVRDDDDDGLRPSAVPERVAAGATVSVVLAAVAAGRLVDVAVPVELGHTVLNS